ncbi:MAG TPA: type 1 glutamine amidotransferase, partial [Chromatiales bacterium]|nr:type 1 glutamine amidotransferase [Chromatiales bacterium]
MPDRPRKKVLIITADGFEDSELLVPLQQLREIGFKVDVASLKKGMLRGKHGHTVEAGLSVDGVSADSCEGLLLPGGRAPAKPRDQPAVQAVVRAFMAQKKSIAAICHGPQILLSAGVLKGKRATGYQAIADELRRGDVVYEDRAAVVDSNLITSRHPGDLPAFMEAFMAAPLQTQP